MASQNGILGLQGTVGGLVFAKNGTVRQKPASNKAAFASAASLARTRENASEFGRAATGGKLIRSAFRSLIATASDARMVSRLTQRVRQIVGLDEANDRGERVVDKDNVGGLLGFDFNSGAGLGQSLFFPFAVATAGADVTLTVPRLNPATDLVAPQGATHFELLYGVATMNFETGTYEAGTVAAPFGTQALSAATMADQALVATLPTAPTADDVVMAVLGVNFYQSLNGKLYPLNNNATNPLAIAYVA
ncbi:hypothetical protein Q3A66_16270 [Hymenobacter sp. BT770]|uniref:hypothetical protein n=1 Tax=Hymenobacter sp. BT770 TaxID=2886942 RepID=UPI001D0F8D7C|nr:hypothetical protein [Hymenobacter sp. BT770]MCC3154571.1 hypothetical protein [Hymenobacter sp. BT770]MDO3416625.1 hypothetical protein [Hymenobacter sp. BT770]